MAAAGFNFKKLMAKLKKETFLLFLQICFLFNKKSTQLKLNFIK